MTKKEFWDKYHFRRMHIMISDELPCNFRNKKNIDQWLYIQGVQRATPDSEYADWDYKRQRICKDCWLKKGGE